MPSRKYRAFISYSHVDQRWAAWLHKALETYAIPKRLVGRKTAAGIVPKRFAPVFRDRDELPSATDLGREVNDALAQSDALVVICSPHSATSQWVDAEVREFKRLGGGARVFCLIVGGEPNASDAIADDAGTGVSGNDRKAEECFAPSLRYQVDADGALTSKRAEPIAADARDGKDGKTGAKLKLLSGLLDVGFDELRQRELQRRIQRLGAIAALALVMMAVTSVLAIQAIVARKAAEVAQQAAERRQQQSEDLIGYMLGDLNDKLGEVGRLDIMQGVADKAMAYFAALPTADVTDTSLAQRAMALQKIGSVRMDQGKIPQALEAYQSAVRIQSARLQRAPNDAAREVDYAQSLIWVGNGYWFKGDLERAGQQFGAASEALQVAAHARPDDSDLAVKLAGAQNNYGHVLEARGDFDGARTQYEAVLDVFTALNDKHPDQDKWQEELGYAHNNLGKLAYENGDLEQAVTRYLSDRILKARLVARTPNNQQWRSELAVSDAILSGALEMSGEDVAAQKYARSAVASGMALVTLDPTNASRRDYLALYKLRLAGLLRQQGQLPAASTQADEAIRFLTALVTKDSTNSDWPVDLAKAQLEGARLALASRQPDAVRSLAQAALATVEPLLAKRADDRTSILIATQADYLLGDLAAAERNSVLAHAQWRRARDRIAPLAATGGNPEVIDTWVRALLRLGDRKTATPIIARLQRMGYRNPDFVALLERDGIAYPINAAFREHVAGLMQ